MTRDEFHIHLYGPLPLDSGMDSSPPGEDARTVRSERESSGPTSALDPNRWIATTPIPASFEEAASRLAEQLPEVLLEPDGSLAWASPDHQVVGMIYDAMGSIQYLELRGRCTAEQLRQLVEVISGMTNVDRFAAMLLPERQWKIFQSVAESFQNRSEGATESDAD
jgi:hypothetical protein